MIQLLYMAVRTAVWGKIETIWLLKHVHHGYDGPIGCPLA